MKKKEGSITPLTSFEDIAWKWWTKPNIPLGTLQDSSAYTVIVPTVYLTDYCIRTQGKLPDFPELFLHYNLRFNKKEKKLEINSIVIADNWPELEIKLKEDKWEEVSLNFSV